MKILNTVIHIQMHFFSCFCLKKICLLSHMGALQATCLTVCHPMKSDISEKVI